MDALDVLADPSRRRIVELLSGGELHVERIAAHFDSSRPAISQHLAILVDGGVVDARREGTRRYYRLNPVPLAAARDWLSAQTDRWTRVLDALEHALDQGAV